MDWNTLNGREIESAYWPDSDSEQGRCLIRNETRRMVLHVEYMGDRTEVWIVVLDHEREASRYNGRMVEAIAWAEA